MAITKKQTEIQKMKFEEALSELEDISNRMSQGSLPLDESVQCYARGVELAKHCRNLLDEAEKKIQVLDGELKGLGNKNLRANSGEPANNNEGFGLDDGIPF